MGGFNGPHETFLPAARSTSHYSYSTVHSGELKNVVVPVLSWEGEKICERMARNIDGVFFI